jgi:hypothetical protein
MPNQIRLAYDRASVRSINHDGSMIVEVSPISKACVNPYRGSEIPSANTLGLDPDRVYYLLRDPAELAAGATTFNNLPLLNRHIPAFAHDFPKDAVCGSTGTDAAFDGTYLNNSLVVWTQDEIDGINTKQQYELSSCYRYDADMTSGVFDGVRYDGIMRNIRGNHVALVREGRAGPDVMVGDSKLLEKPEMAKKLTANARAVKAALIGFFSPMLAADAQIKDLTTVAVAVKSLKGATEQAAFVTKVTAAMDGKLIEGASLDKLPQLVAMLAADEADEPDDKEKPAKDADDDEDEEAKKKRLAAMDADKVDKPAMDAAIAAAVAKTRTDTVAHMNAMHAALEAVKPHVGVIAAMDSAENVFKYALDAKGVKTDGVHPSAYGAMVAMLGTSTPAPADHVTKRLAADAAMISDFDKRYPAASKVKVA